MILERGIGMKKKVILTLLFAVILISITGCTSKQKIDSDIISFKYHYGSYSPGYYDYDISVIDEKVIFNAKGYNDVNFDVEKLIDKSYLEELTKIINDNEIYKWNGFDKSDKNILDGYDFNLEVNYSNGKSLKAHGYMKYPKNYNEGHKALSEFLEHIIED